MSEKFLWRFSWECGRQGSIEGLFVATEEVIQNSIDKEISFGEILGKHSDIYGDLGLEDLERVDLDSEIVEKVTEILGDTWSGYNPLDYMRYTCPECGDTNESDEFDLDLNKCVYCRDNED